ncbi:diguanylate cyclase (GGDEF) domain-containing protein [Micromonospora pattaloongensis]|uniref:Diguanylate cyclase (GGDEF) domain-containing protein n=1 Tax=Micromonospora pattaloongensis TaxID=405436 RepID=A0A1H3NSN0_9ACTN|nr:GGDEF domain-containing protein [Micromonospora pattaloongensis]SDY91700.1 diguanylate cyclase (GGDEF) domain-containing protein [Micromonospora pattaloongensis]
MADEPQLLAPVQPFGPFNGFAWRLHELTVKGRNTEALHLADEYEWVASLLGDERTVTMLTQTRMYAYVGLGRLPEALVANETLLRRHRASGARASEAKALADRGDILIRLGRIDEGLHRLADAMAILEQTPRTNPRYISALSSVGEAARSVELFELADQCAHAAVEAFPPGTDDRAAAELVRTELLLEWGLRLEQVDLVDEAGLRFARAAQLARHWVTVYRGHGPDGESPLAAALLALGLAKIGDIDEALELCTAMLVPLRRAGQFREARLVHLAHGVCLRGRGELRAARREFVAAEELSARAGHASQRLLSQYELAVLAAAEFPGDAADAMLAALRGHARHLWRLRMERRSMLQQAKRRVWLEAERARADSDAAQDALTGLGNRRLFDRHLASVEDASAVVLLLVDVDRFKVINDRYSHGVGDRVLREVASVLQAHCRPDDVPIRFGGDEFALFLRTDLETAARVGERIRQVVEARDWDDFAPGLRVTLSMGVAALNQGMDGRDLFDSADRQLYVAKGRGRNQLAA